MFGFIRSKAAPQPEDTNCKVGLALAGESCRVADRVQVEGQELADRAATPCSYQTSLRRHISALEDDTKNASRTSQL